MAYLKIITTFLSSSTLLSFVRKRLPFSHNRNVANRGADIFFYQKNILSILLLRCQKTHRDITSRKKIVGKEAFQRRASERFV